MKKIEDMIRSISPLLFVVARVGFGVLMMTHGYPKLLAMSEFIGRVDQMGFPLPQVLAPLAMAAELLGGLFVAIGFKVRLASVFILITMLNAAFIVHAADPFQKKEFALVYAILALVFMAKGAGKFSLDRE